VSGDGAWIRGIGSSDGHAPFAVAAQIDAVARLARHFAFSTLAATPMLDPPMPNVARRPVLPGHSRRDLSAVSVSRARKDDAALVGIVLEIALGNSDALTALYESTVSHLYAIARCVLRCPRDTEEIVGDVFVYVWQNSHRYDTSRGAVMGWLSVMTRNRAIDRIRQRRNNLSLDDQSAGPLSRSLPIDSDSPEQCLARREDANLVYRALALQTPLRRRLIELAFLGGLCYEEVAVTTGLPLGTVKSHIRRTLKSMRAALEVAPHNARAPDIT
jgi:RNA polymerase sigma factor (sigma-70 family)